MNTIYANAGKILPEKCVNLTTGYLEHYLTNGNIIDPAQEAPRTQNWIPPPLSRWQRLQGQKTIHAGIRNSKV